MGLRRDKVQSIFTGFYILPRADDKEASTYQEKRYVQKKGNYLSRSTTHLIMDSGAHVMRKFQRRVIKNKSYRKISQGTVYKADMFTFFSLYPNKFGKIKIDYSHRELFMRVKKNNSNISYIPTVKQGCNV
jgi:hypothetical protein